MSPRQEGLPPWERSGVTAAQTLQVPSWPDKFPLTAEHLKRLDETDDAIFYQRPRVVHHVDAVAATALCNYYTRVLNPDSVVLDLMSSWTSHLAKVAGEAKADGYFARVSGIGMNAAELAANAAATEAAVVIDLNGGESAPRLPYADESFDFVTSAASVGYLTRPQAVFAEMHRVLRRGGVAIVSFSNRCFAEKATSLWLGHMDEGVALCSVVRNFFYFGPPRGWVNVSSADLSPHPTRGDPMWIVTAVKA